MFHVGQFVDELQKGVSDAHTASTKKSEKPMMEGIPRSSSRSRMKGPADEMWDVQSTTSQETFKTADKEEGFSVDRATNSASQTPKNESAVAKNVHKSLWAHVADIVHLGWIQRGDAHDSSDKSVKKSSSSNSQSTEGWLSSQEHDNDGWGRDMDYQSKGSAADKVEQWRTRIHGGFIANGGKLAYRYAGFADTRSWYCTSSK
jgi:tRNA(adenine34) deaminase